LHHYFCHETPPTHNNRSRGAGGVCGPPSNPEKLTQLSNEQLGGMFRQFLLTNPDTYR